MRPTATVSAQYHAKEVERLELVISELESDLARCHAVRRRAFRQGWQACIETVLEYLEEQAASHFDPLTCIRARRFGEELRELYGELFPPVGDER